MNQVVLIGNGFDLAHGLKTSYSDFILWYFKEVATLFNQSGFYEDPLVSIHQIYQRRHFNEASFYKLSEVLKYLSNEEIDFRYISEFFRTIVSRNIKYNWVDIEYLYYQELLRHFKIIEKPGISETRIDDFKTTLKQINNCLDNLSKSLVNYLSTISVGSNIKLDTIQEHFTNIEKEQLKTKGSILLLNFNYTSVADLYFMHSSHKNVYKKIDIHGSISDKSNPIIFGYGDDMEPNFQKLVNFNDNEIMLHMKSINYFKTLNYNSLMSYLESDGFVVNIMGHSCGLSDRLLLNRIFEHTNCRKIKIFYHQIDIERNDYTNKTIEIFRHFKNIVIAQERIVSFPNSKPLVPIRIPVLEPLVDVN